MGHQGVLPVLRVELRVLQQFVGRDVLLQDGKHEDREGGVEGVVHHQEVGLEQRARAVVGEEHEEELARAEGNVLVE